MAHKVIFLDRDGTINVDHGYVYSCDQWEFTLGAIDALRILHQAGFSLAIVSNQSGIADGRFTEVDVHTLHERVKADLYRSGVGIDAIVYCPHGRAAGCGCRKPQAGLARQVEDLIGPIAYAGSWVVGDKESDVGFGKNIGARTALIRSRYWKAKSLTHRPDLVVNSLRDFADAMTTTA